MPLSVTDEDEKRAIVEAPGAQGLGLGGVVGERGREGVVPVNHLGNFGVLLVEVLVLGPML